MSESKQKHTPGPWTIAPGKHRNNEDALTILDRDGEPIADVLRGLICSVDLALMAAAPELLAACEVAVRALRDYPQYDDPDFEPSLESEALELARAAIDKATA